MKRLPRRLMQAIADAECVVRELVRQMQTTPADGSERQDDAALLQAERQQLRRLKNALAR